MSLTNYTATAFLNHLKGRSAFTMPAGYIGLFTAVGSDNGTGFTEASGGGYARVAANGVGVWAAPTGGDPVSISTNAQLNFATPSVAWGTILAWGYFDASAGGNLLEWDYLGSYAWLPCYVTAGSPCRIYAPGNSYAQGDNFVYTTKYGGQTPLFGSGNFTGLMTVQSPSGDLWTPYNGGAGVNTTATGSGMVRKVSTFIPLANAPVFFVSGNLSSTMQ